MPEPFKPIWPFVLLFTLPVYLNAQEVIERVNNLYATHYDSTTGIHTRIFKDSIGYLNLDSKEKGGSKIFNIGNISLQYEPIRLGTELYLVNNSGGLIFRIDSDSIRRIDKSYDHKMQTWSLIFPYRDTVFRHGGYGFWSARKELTYFEKSTSEWEIVRPLGSNTTPPGLFAHFGWLQGHSLKIFGGIRTEIKDPLEQIQNQEVWSFDFNSKEWTKIGVLATHIPIPSYDINPFWIKNNLVFLKEDLHTYDMTTMEHVIYSSNPFNNKTVRNINIKPFYHGKSVYLYRFESLPKVTHPPFSVQFVRISTETFFQNEVLREPLLAQSLQRFFWPTLITVIAFGFLWHQKQRRNRRKLSKKLQLTKTGVNYLNQSINLTHQELAVLHLLLSSESEISTNQVLEVTQNPNLDYTHNLRMKNQLIEKLNVGLRTLLNIKEDIITIQRSSIDRRIRTYSIRKEYFQTGT